MLLLLLLLFRLTGVETSLLLLTRTRWRKLWMILQESYVIGISPKTGEVRIVLLFDKGNQLGKEAGWGEVDAFRG